MNILAAVDKTFAGGDVSPKKTIPPFININVNENLDDDFYSKFLKDMNGKDKTITNPISKHTKKEKDQSLSNILIISGKTSGKLSSRKNLDKSIDLGHKKDEEAASRTSLLNPRKLKKDKHSSNSNNMLLLIPGMTNSNTNKEGSGTKLRSKKSSNISNINMKSLREEEGLEHNNNFNRNANIVTEKMASNVNILKILIPQSDKLKEFDEELREEEKQLVIQPNTIDFEICAQPRPHVFLFDTLKIQKLNSIKELVPNKPKDLRQSPIILNQLNSKTEKKPKQKEQQIIIINQNPNSNDCNNYSLESNEKRQKKKKKNNKSCCLPLN